MSEQLSKLSPETTALALNLACLTLGKPFRDETGAIIGTDAYLKFREAMIAEGFDENDAYMLAAIINDMGSVNGVKNLLTYFAATKRRGAA